MKKFFKSTVTVAISVLIIFSTWMTDAQAKQPVRHEFDGKIDIGGYGLYMHKQGKGKPTILFESGYGTTYDTWNKVQPQISEHTTTISYNRAGLGESDQSPLQHTSLNQVYELHTMLQKAKIKGPYILVAQSIGGYNARLFANEFPKEVAGIIFVDASHEDQEQRLISLLPPEIQTFFQTQFTLEGSYEDINISADQVRNARGALKDIPITVISATNHGFEEIVGPELNSEIEAVWRDMQNDLASLAVDSKHIIAEGSGHNIQTEQPQIVIDAINDMIERVKHNKK